jgi:hypothetical protein
MPSQGVLRACEPASLEKLEKIDAKHASRIQARGKAGSLAQAYNLGSDLNAG